MAWHRTGETILGGSLIYVYIYIDIYTYIYIYICVCVCVFVCVCVSPVRRFKNVPGLLDVRALKFSVLHVAYKAYLSQTGITFCEKLNSNAQFTQWRPDIFFFKTNLTLSRGGGNKQSSGNRLFPCLATRDTVVGAHYVLRSCLWTVYLNKCTLKFLINCMSWSL